MASCGTASAPSSRHTHVCSATERRDREASPSPHHGRAVGGSPETTIGRSTELWRQGRPSGTRSCRTGAPSFPMNSRGSIEDRAIAGFAVTTFLEMTIPPPLPPKQTPPSVVVLRTWKFGWPRGDPSPHSYRVPSSACLAFRTNAPAATPPALRNTLRNRFASLCPIRLEVWWIR